MTLSPLPAGISPTENDPWQAESTHVATVQRLQGIIRALAEFGREEEQQFLAIGSHLADFLGRSREVSRQSDEAIDSLMRQEGQESLDALATLLDDFEAHIEEVIAEARKHDDALQRVLLHLGRIEEPLQSLAKVVKVLFALSFSTRVESAQGQAGLVLQTLAADLKELAAKIDDKTEAVRDRLRAMTGLVLTAQEKTRKQQGDSLLQARTTLHQCRLLLAMLGDRREESLGNANLLKHHSRDVSAAISEVVSSIQYHDITRQQVEHVRSAFEDMCTRLGSPEAEGEAQASLVDVCRVQAAQLQHTRSELVAAVGRIIKSLFDIARAVDHLARQTRMLSVSAEASGTTFFGDIEPVIAAVTAILADSTTDNRDAIVAVGAVLTAFDELSRLLEEIELIGTEMKLISLNAGITAAHSMERGAGLGVIAASIQTLSGEVLSRTGEFAAVYRQMDQLARALSDEELGAAEVGQITIDDLNRRASLLVGRLREMNRDLVLLLRTMDGKSSALALEVAAAADAISIHVDAGQLVDDLLEELQAVTAACQRPLAARSAPETLDRLARRYTMQSERKVHHDAHLLLAESAAESAHAGKEPVDASGFGTNVELF